MFTLNCKGRLLTINKPVVMGIINVTPDSFFSGSRHEYIDEIVSAAGMMLSEGASILDIGGQSTRPGSAHVTATEEIERVIPAIQAIHKAFPQAMISVDTYYSQVAEQAVAAGACIINDISAGSLDENLIDTVARLQVPYILMHMHGRPDTMQNNPQYEDVTQTVLEFMISKMAILKSKGIQDIIIDPGFGFGKTIDHNFQLLKNLSVFKMFDCPVLLGISRKSTIYKTLQINPEDALNGSTVMHTIGLLNGASILRAHDVREAVEAVLLVGEYKKRAGIAADTPQRGGTPSEE